MLLFAHLAGFDGRPDLVALLPIDPELQVSPRSGVGSQEVSDVIRKAPGNAVFGKCNVLRGCREYRAPRN